MKFEQIRPRNVVSQLLKALKISTVAYMYIFVLLSVCFVPQQCRFIKQLSHCTNKLLAFSLNLSDVCLDTYVIL